MSTEEVVYQPERPSVDDVLKVVKLPNQEQLVFVEEKTNKHVLLLDGDEVILSHLSQFIANTYRVNTITDGVIGHLKGVCGIVLVRSRLKAPSSLLNFTKDTRIRVLKLAE